MSYAINVEKRMSNESGSAAGPDALTDAQKQFEKFADRVVDVDTALAFIQDAASVASGLWVTYLGILAYLGITVGAVTHADLFLERPIKLPLLGDAPVPLVAFFILAPIIFVIWHAYTLLHFDILAAKVRVLESELRALGKGAEDLVTQFRWRLPANIFVQFLAGHPSLRKGRIGLVSKLIAWTSLIFGPIFLLLLVQVKFLPYHGELVTWLHRALVLIDLFLLWVFWPAVVAGGKQIWSLRGPRWFLAALSCGAFMMSVVWATFPGEWLDERLAGQWIPPNTLPAWLEATDETECPAWTSMHDLLFNGSYDWKTHSRRSFFSNTLVLPGFKLPDEKQFDAAKLDSVDATLAREGGHFENAIFEGADLRKIDLANAQLQGADLLRANLQSAQLQHANLDGSNLFQAKLQLASFDAAKADGAYFAQAELQGAFLQKATLRAASLSDAKLQAAKLPQAQLEGASLRNAQLQGADFGVSDKPASADLADTDFSGARVSRTNFYDANLKAAFRIEDLGEQPITDWSFETDGRLTWPISGQTKGALERFEELQSMGGERDNKPPSALIPLGNPEKHRNALEKWLNTLVCPGDADALAIVRRLIDPTQYSDRSDADLINTALARCLVPVALTHQDKYVLETLKERVEKAHKERVEKAQRGIQPPCPDGDNSAAQ